MFPIVLIYLLTYLTFFLFFLLLFCYAYFYLKRCWKFFTYLDPGSSSIFFYFTPFHPKQNNITVCFSILIVRFIILDYNTNANGFFFLVQLWFCLVIEPIHFFICLTQLIATDSFFFWLYYAYSSIHFLALISSSNIFTQKTYPYSI